jgi:HAE1 family hydrophobic/amphiphilic exporter-1
MVIFLFLRNISATVIPSAALPMSIVGTFAVMWALGYTVDNLSLLAITLSVGFVVDDAIVMLENIVRHMEMGKGVMEAALDGSREIAFTILSMTFSLAAVFIPVLFLGGIMGRLLHEFAVTIAAAILVSGFVSLSLTPMLCSRFLRPPGSERHGRLYMMTERWFDRLLEGYRRSLTVVMTYRRATLAVALGLLVATLYLLAAIPKGFLPIEDQGQVLMFTKAAQGISYDAMVKHQEAIADIIRRDPNVTTFFSSAGATGFSGGSNTGILFAHLKPRGERKLTVDQVMDELRPKLATVPGIIAFLQNPPPIQIGAKFTEATYQLALQSPNSEVLYKYAQILERRLRASHELTDVTSDLQIANPQVNVVLDRDKAHSLGISAQSIEDALDSAYGQRQVSTIYAPNDEFKVILQVEPQYQANPATLSLLYVRAQGGKLVPLDTIARLERTLGPLAINHSGQLTAVTISFNVAPGVSLGKALDDVKQLTNDTVPASISTAFQGTAEEFQSSMRNLGILLVMAILVIYMVLGVLYESFIHPVTILSGLPAAGFGALLTLMIFHMDLDLLAFVGIIMLVGLVKKNAILMIDFALDAQRTEGKSPAEAIFEGSIIRFRPIMMTTMSALMGTLPIALGMGAGADSRRPLGVAVVGGLFFSQLLTLYITPVIYTYMESFHDWITGLRDRTPRAEAERRRLGGGKRADEEPPRRRAAS